MAPDHNIEFNEDKGEKASIFRAYCSCGWVSGDSRHRNYVEDEVKAHLEGHRQPWNHLPGEKPGWEV